MKRLSFKEYKDLLEDVRRWVQPYRNGAAKLILHLQFQTAEIKRLEDELRHFKQQSLLDAKPKEQTPYKPNVRVESQEKFPLARRLSDIIDKYPKTWASTEEWRMITKWNELNDAMALILVKNYKET